MANETSTESGVDANNQLVIARTITSARWRRAEDAFYKHAEVTRHGSIRNLRTAILAAVRELLR